MFTLERKGPGFLERVILRDFFLLVLDLLGTCLLSWACMCGGGKGADGGEQRD